MSVEIRLYNANIKTIIPKMLGQHLDSICCYTHHLPDVSADGVSLVLSSHAASSFINLEENVMKMSSSSIYNGDWDSYFLKNF